jgi:DNA-binding response OmpR family regulator
VNGAPQIGRALGAAPIRALIVEDNRDICANIATYLEKCGYVLDFAYDGLTAMRLASTHPFDVIVLDLMIPGMDGLTFCQRLRDDARMETPVLMLTARDTLDDRLKGFDAGADDYLVKPFALQELHARLRALYKRSHRHADTLLAVGDLTMNRSTLQVHRAGQRVELNPAGMKLLQRLMEESPSVVAREELETLLWADEPPDGDALRSHMYKLRQAVDRPFDRPLIHTVHRIGYRIAEDTP